MTNFKKSLLAVAAMSTFGVANAATFTGAETYADGSRQEVSFGVNSVTGKPFAQIYGYTAPMVTLHVDGSMNIIQNPNGTYSTTGFINNVHNVNWEAVRTVLTNDGYRGVANAYPSAPTSGWTSVNGIERSYRTLPVGRQDDGSYVLPNAARNGFTTYTAAEATAWKLSNAVSTTVAGKSFAIYAARSDNAKTYFIDGQVVSQDKFAEELKKSTEAEAAAKAAATKKDDHVAERTRKTNATVAGAIAVNIIIDEVFGDLLKEQGAGVGASVGGHFEKPELNIGVAVDLGKHLGEDFGGVSVHAGVGVESGEISVGARKTWRVAEYVTTSVGASIGAQGVRVGPELMVGTCQFGIGVAMWGPVPVPQIKIFGYTASVVPHLALANAVVGGATIAYKAVRTEMKKADAFVKAIEDAAPANVDDVAQEIAHDGPSD